MPVDNYRSFYNDPNKNAYADYTAVYSNYDIPVGNAPPIGPADLASLVYSSATPHLPAGFLLLGTNGRIRCYHRLSLFPTRMGLPVTPWDGEGFASINDLLYDQSTVVNWRTAYFNIVGNSIQIPTAQTIDDAFAANPLTERLGPFTNADAGTVTARVRHTIFLPSPYISLFLDRELTPKEAWLQLRARIVADNKSIECAPLLTWLQAVLTQTANQGPSLVQVTTNPSTPDAANIHHRELIQQRRGLLLSDFPNLGKVVLQAGHHAIATNINALVTDRQTERAAKVAAKALAATTTPTDLLGAAGVAILLRLAQVGSEHALPPVWKQMGKAKGKARQLMELNNALATEAISRGVNANVHVTPSIKDKVLRLEYAMVNRSDWLSGLGPFVFGTGTPEETQKRLGVVAMYEFMNSGGGMPSLSEGEILITPEAIMLPKNLPQARDMLQKTELFYAVTQDNVVAQAMAVFNAEFDQKLHELMYAYQQVGDQLLLPTRLVRWIQLRLDRWFRTQRLSASNIPAPNLTEVFEKIENEEQWFPQIPNEYLGQLTTPTTQFPPSMAPTGGAPPPPQAPPAPAVPGGDEGAQSIIRNTAYNVAFEPFRTLNIPIATIRRRLRDNPNMRRPPPSPASLNTEMCLAFHIKGMCNTRCGKGVDHVPHTAEQDAPLLAWCTECYTGA